MGSRTRSLLSYSLAALLLLTAATGIVALLVLRQIREGEAALRASLVERSGWLEEIRAAIYESGAIARDYFADPEGPDAPALQVRLAQLQKQTQEALTRYSARGTAESRETVNLRGEVAAYWRVLDLMAEMAQKRRTPRMDAYFRGQLAQRRVSMLRISEEIETAQQREVRLGEAGLADMYGRFQSLLIAELALVMAAGLVLSIGAIRRVVRLEGEARALSAQLVRAQEEERRSIARELHDDVGQALSGLKLEVASLAPSVEPAALRAKLESAASAVEQSIETVRRMALELRPSMLDDLGLVPALEWQAREVERQAGVAVEIDAEESAGELPEAHRTCIYRVAQELLRNCVRHAGASRLRVKLRKTGQAVTLEVDDNGKGFVPARARGLGLLGIEERAAQLGGKLRIRSEPGRGTTAAIELPV